MSQEPVKREINQEVLEKLKKDIMFEVKPKKLTFREKLARILNIKVFRFDRQQRKEEVQSFITISNDGIGVYTKNDFVWNNPFRLLKRFIKNVLNFYRYGDPLQTVYVIPLHKRMVEFVTSKKSLKSIRNSKVRF